MNRILLAGILLLICANYYYPANGIVPSVLQCPKLAPQKTFNLTRYMGQWYEYEKFWFLPGELDLSSCLSIKYFRSAANESNQVQKRDQFGIELSQKLRGQPIMNSGISFLNSTDGSARLMFDLLITQSPVPFHFRVPYIVLHTDYDNYIIKWACINMGQGELSIRKYSAPCVKRENDSSFVFTAVRSIISSQIPYRWKYINGLYDNRKDYISKSACKEYLSILSRKRGFLSARKKKEAYKFIQKAGLSTESLIKSAQTNCD